MATNSIDKAVNQAPMGVGDTDGMGGLSMPENLEADLEIEIEDPESVTITTPDMEIVIDPDAIADDEFGANLAEEIDPQELQTIASDLLGDFEEDLASRKDWIQTYVDGLELLGMKVEERTEPWPGACGVYHPLLSEALVKFQAETMMETFPAAGPVKTQIIGKETKENKAAAKRVQDDMNYQLTDKMPEYRAEHERMLWGLGLSGNAFKKVYYDPSLKRQVSIYVPAEDVVVPYGVSDLKSAPRVTHVMRKTPNEMRRLMHAGFYLDIDLPEPQNTFDEIEKSIAEKMGFRASSDDRYKVLEVQCDLDLVGYEDVDDGEETGILIGAFAKSGTSIIRQLVDAGTLSNLPGGFKTRGLRVKGDDTPIAPAEFRDVDVTSGTIKDNIMTLPYKEPSQVLYTLLGNIVEEGRRFASAADLKLSDMSAQAPVGTTLAILERTLKVMSAVQARIHYAMKEEFKLLKGIIRDYTSDEYSYEPVEGSERAKGSDYDMVDVIPVSDPNAATMAQKVTQYQAVLQMAAQAPQLYNLPYLHRQMLEVLGIKNAQKLVPMEDDQEPRDPVSENMDVLRGKPVKAFIYQDHEAHITVHMSAMQDPKLMALVQQSPMAKQMGAALAAHIQDHLAFEYRKQIEEAAGVPYPAPNAEMDEDTEVEISRLAAAAAQQVLQGNKAEVAQQKAQQAAQDPIVQMQQQELQIKQQEAQTKQQKVALDAAEKMDRLELEKERIAAQERIAGMQTGAKIAMDKSNLSAKQQEAGLRMGIELAREAAQEDQAMQQMQQNQQQPRKEDE